jgi:hypothetical protein
MGILRAVGVGVELFRVNGSSERDPWSLDEHVGLRVDGVDAQPGPEPRPPICIQVCSMVAKAYVLRRVARMAYRAGDGPTDVPMSGNSTSRIG